MVKSLFQAILFWVLVIGACKPSNGPSTQSAIVPQLPVKQEDNMPKPINGGVLPLVTDKLDGLTFVAPPKPFPQNPMPHVVESGAGWISVIPYAYTRANVPSVRFSEHDWQWWGETPEGARETIRLAHAAGLKVMLKPQVYIPYHWTGSMDFNGPENWAKWEADYEKYILRFAQLADSMQVELFCIATEFRNSIEKRPLFWQELIQKVRKTYHGKLTYSSNWDDWDKVPFWNDMDYIGLGGYFPLVDAPTPSVDSLRKAWQPIKNRLKAFSQTWGKPILFTEFGYLSVDGCGWQNWELEKGIESRPINEQAQANCFEALFAEFFPESWWAGGFMWKWFPNMQGHEGYPERDYTPQGKLGEKVVRNWYGQTIPGIK